jgi:hypothetical protein
VVGSVAAGRSVCEVWIHHFNWELRLQIDARGLTMSSVVRSHAEILAKMAERRSTMPGERRQARPP